MGVKMHQIGFDNEKYLRLQSQHIRERIDRFGGKLYLEFGGKLYDDTTRRESFQASSPTVR